MPKSDYPEFVDKINNICLEIESLMNHIHKRNMENVL